MNKPYRTGAIGALLDEYEKAIAELYAVVNDITDEELIAIADITTTDINCRSIQSILTHVVRSGFAYPTYIRKHLGVNTGSPENTEHFFIKDYQKDLEDIFVFTAGIFKDIPENQLEQADNRKKLITSWGQSYDIEQMMEHAIVHILRHRRQIENFSWPCV